MAQATGQSMRVVAPTEAIAPVAGRELERALLFFFLMHGLAMLTMAGLLLAVDFLVMWRLRGKAVR